MSLIQLNRQVAGKMRPLVFLMIVAMLAAYFPVQPVIAQEGDVDRLSVVSTSPLNGQQGVEPNSRVKIQFNQDIELGSEFTAIKMQAGIANIPVQAVRGEDGRSLELNPAALNHGVNYQVTIPAKAVVSSDGTGLEAPYIFAFTTSSLATVYTSDADFDQGVLTGVEHETTHDQLQLSQENVTLPFIWVPNNDQTVSKINTETGLELGRYRIAPAGINAQPSRTTVDLEGNCYVGNRQCGTVVKIGLLEAGLWEDRNGNGVCDTSKDTNQDGNITGDEILPWAQDECVLYEVVVIPGKEGVFTPGSYSGGYANDYWNPGPRSLAIDQKNNLWVGCYGSETFYYINNTTRHIDQTVDVSPWGHTPYGAVIDEHGVIWSSSLSSHVLRIDPTQGEPVIQRVNLPHTAYGVGLDYVGHLFVASDRVSRIDTQTGQIEWSKYLPQISYIRGVACTGENDVWMADSNGNKVVRLNNDGEFQASVPIGNTPTGVSVDAAGKVWACNLNDNYVKRIDPQTNQVDLSKEVVNSGGHYSYSDMTGILARTISTKIGSWTIVKDGGVSNAKWDKVAWNADVPEGSSVTVKARYSEDKVNWTPQTSVTNGVVLPDNAAGRYVELLVTLQSSSKEDSPSLYDLTVTQKDNEAPFVTACDPADGATVGVSSAVYVTFSENIQPGSKFNDINLTAAGNLPVLGKVVSIKGSVLKINCSEQLPYDQNFTVTLPKGAVMDGAANELTEDFATTFKTSPESDPPTIVSVQPADDSVGVSVYTDIRIQFSEPVVLGPEFEGIVIQPEDEIAIQADADNGQQPQRVVDYVYELDGATLTLTPRVPLDYETEYKVTVVKGAVMDTAGNELAENFTSSFKTAREDSAPTVVSAQPQEGAVDVAVSTDIRFQFNEPIFKGETFDNISLISVSNAGALNQETLSIVDYTYSLDGASLILKPNSALDYKQMYRVRLPAKAVQDAAGNPLAEPYSLTFETAAAPHRGHGGGGGGNGVTDTSEGPFIDVPEDYWASSEISDLVEQGLLVGFPDQTFRPEASIKRGELATIIAKALKLNNPKPEQNTFGDVPLNHWANQAVEAVNQAGIMVGYGNRRFWPEGEMSREEVVVVVMRALHYGGGKAGDASLANLDIFQDKDQIPSWAKASVAEAVDLGLVQGVRQGFFGAGTKTNRAQVAVLVYDMLKLRQK